MTDGDRPARRRPGVSRMGTPLSYSKSTLTQVRIQDRAALARRSKKVKITMPRTPWDEEKNE